MNSKSTWIWITIAAILFAALFAVNKFSRKPAPDLVALLPRLKADAVTSVQFTPAGQLEIRAERTNRTWQLRRPIIYPAQAASIEALLNALERLAPARTIPGAELRERKNADAEFGFDKRTTLTLYTGEESRQLVIGARTAPGDQIYTQVVGTEGVFVVDARLLQLLPAKVDDWRDTSLVDLRYLMFNHITVSNATAQVQLKQENTNSLWRLSYPINARADNFRLMDALQKLHVTRVTSFVTDDPRIDADVFGLNAPELEITLAQDTNTLVTVQFGRSVTNDSTQVYARRSGFPTIVAVERQMLEPWLASVEKFRDPNLITRQRSPDEIEVRGADNFILQRTQTNAWRLVDSEMPVDPGFVGQLLVSLATAPIREFKDSITDADLPKFGLDQPSRHMLLRTKANIGGTNELIADLSFGAISEGIGYVRRADENPVYAIGIDDYARLSTAPWRLRDRRIWRFPVTNVVSVVAKQGERTLAVNRLGPNSWQFAPGSQGILNGAALEEAVHRLGELDSAGWLGRGEEQRGNYGFAAGNLTLTVELKDGTKHEVEFGGESADGYPYATAKLGGESWFFEFPKITFEYLKFSLFSTAKTP